MGISRLESIIRNAELDKTVKATGITKMALKDLPAITNHRANQQIRTVVIDTSEFIYKSIIGGDHTSGILNFLEKMFRCQLMPIFVFDGKPPKEKNRIIEERKRIKERARERVESLKGQIDKADAALNIVTGLHESGQSIGNSSDGISVTGGRVFNQKDDETTPEIRITINDDFNCSSNKSLDNTSQESDENSVNQSVYINYIDNMNMTYERLLGIIGGDDDNYTSSMSDNIRNGNTIHAEDIIDRLRAKISNLYSETERMGKKMVGIQDVQYTDIKQLFNHFNIPYIHAGVEAEMICAALVKLGIADYCIGNDMDLFALGCPRIIRNINFRDDFVDVYYLDIILDNLDLSYLEFIDLCILLGSDYTGRLGGVKNYHILEYVQKYRSIESILENIDDINNGLVGECTDDGMQRVVRIPESFNYNEARAIFLTEFTEEQIASLFHTVCTGLATQCNGTNALSIVDGSPVIDIYQSCANKCLELRHNYSVYDKTIEFCQIKCGRLNNMLITKKINAIIWSNLFNDENPDDFIMVKSKKTSPINISGRRTDIINDIRARGHHKNFSRVAFGSSPNHAMVMI